MLNKDKLYAIGMMAARQVRALLNDIDGHDRLRGVRTWDGTEA